MVKVIWYKLSTFSFQTVVRFRSGFALVKVIVKEETENPSGDGDWHIGFC